MRGHGYKKIGIEDCSSKLNKVNEYASTATEQEGNAIIETRARTEAHHAHTIGAFCTHTPSSSPEKPKNGHHPPTGESTNSPLYSLQRVSPVPYRGPTRPVAIPKVAIAHPPPSKLTASRVQRVGGGQWRSEHVHMSPGSTRAPPCLGPCLVHKTATHTILVCRSSSSMGSG